MDDSSFFLNEPENYDIYLNNGQPERKSYDLYFEENIDDHENVSYIVSRNERAIERNDLNDIEVDEIKRNINIREVGNIRTERKKKPKRKVHLSDDAIVFKNYYFSLFTKKKKFPKEYVKVIHKYMMKYIKLPKMTRDQVRCSDLYFQDFEPYQLEILSFLKANQKQIFLLFLSNI